MKIYKMPNGVTRQYEEGKAPSGAILIVNAKAVEEPKNKAIEGSKNKSVKGSKK